MTYAVDTILNPRSFVYASNVDALVLQSITPETRLTFINSTVGLNAVTPNYNLSASNANFLLRKDTTTIADFSIVNSAPLLYIPGDGTVKAPHFEIPADLAAKRSIILKDFNRASDHQFAGFGYSNGRIEYQLPNKLNAHAFFASATSDSSLELMRVTTNGLSSAQVGIGTTAIASNVMLHVAGTTVVGGDLTVNGSLSFDRTGIVQLDPNTSKIATSNLPNRLLYLDETTNKVDPTYLPQTYQFQYLRGNKNVGIGTRSPQQRFHVQGSGVFSERVGVGTFFPNARLHVQEPSAVIPTLILENNVGGSLIEAKLQNSPAFTVVGTHVGVGIGTSVVAPVNAFEVVGNANVRGNVTCSNLTSLGRVSLANLNVVDGPNTYVDQTQYTYDGLPQQAVAAYIPFLFDRGIATSNITTTNGAPYVQFKNCGARIDGEFVLSSQMYVISDARVKTDIEILDDSLTRLERLRGYSYTLTESGKKQVGLLAQEVLDVLPQAVTKLSPTDDYAVSYDSIVPLLVEAVRELSQQLRDLKAQSH